MVYQYRGTLTLERTAKPKPAIVFNPDKCGTYAGYKQHQNHGVPQCAPCKQANSEHVKAWNARKKANACPACGADKERRAARKASDSARKAAHAQQRKTQ